MLALRMAMRTRAALHVTRRQTPATHLVVRFASTVPASDVAGPTSGPAEPAPIMQQIPTPQASSVSAAETLDQAAQAAAESGLRTVPVPVLVGPMPLDQSEVVLDPVAAAEAAAVAADALPTAGGFFFKYPMMGVELLLTTAHETSGLPWWMTIGLTTMSVRLCLVPLQIFQSRSIAKMGEIKPQMDALSAKMREGGQKGTEKGIEQAEKARLDLARLMAANNIKPWMTIVGALGQLPLWLTFFFTMRHLLRDGSGLGLETGGAMWFTDLTSRDPYFILPAVCGASFFGMVQLGDAGQAPGAPMDEKQKLMKMFMKAVAIGMPVLTGWMQSGIFVYWISNNVTGMAQTVTLRQPAVRAFVGMPPLPGTAPLGLLPGQAAAMTPPAGVGTAPPRLEISLGGSKPLEAAPAAAASKKGKRGRSGKRRR